MFFTKAGTLMAWLLVFTGALSVSIGLLARHGSDPALAVNLLQGHSAGSVINAGTVWLVMGLGLGILTEISWSITRPNE